MVRCTIWYHLCNFKNVKNSHGGVTKVNTPPWVFVTFFKLYKCYQIVQRTTKISLHFQTDCWGLEPSLTIQLIFHWTLEKFDGQNAQFGKPCDFLSISLSTTWHQQRSLLKATFTKATNVQTRQCKNVHCALDKTSP